MIDIYDYLIKTFGITHEQAEWDVFPFLQWHLYNHQVITAFWREVQIDQKDGANISAPESVLDKYFKFNVHYFARKDSAVDFKFPNSFSVVPINWQLTFVRGWIGYWIHINNYPLRYNDRYVNLHDLIHFLSPKEDAVQIVKTHNYGDIPKNSFKFIEGEMYCEFIVFYIHIFQKGWFPFPIKAGDICFINTQHCSNNNQQVDLSLIPNYDIYDCIEYTLGAPVKTLSNERHEHLIAKRTQIKETNTAMMEHLSLYDCKAEYHLLKADFEQADTFLVFASMLLAQDYFNLYVSKAQQKIGINMEYTIVKVHPCKIHKIHSIFQLNPDLIPQCWTELQNAQITFENIQKCVQRDIEQTIHRVGFTNSVYPFRTLLQHFYTKWTSTRYKKTMTESQILRRSKNLSVFAGSLMVEAITFVIWSLHVKEELHAIGIAPNQKLQEMQESLSQNGLANKMIQQLYFISTMFPLKENPLENHLYSQINNKSKSCNDRPVPMDDELKALGEWINQQCKIYGFTRRSYQNNENLFEVKQIAYIAGPIEYMHSAKDITDDILEKLDLQDQVIYGNGGSFCSIGKIVRIAARNRIRTNYMLDWFIQNIIPALSTYDDFNIASKYVNMHSEKPSNCQCKCKYQYLLQSCGERKRRKVCT